MESHLNPPEDWLEDCLADNSDTVKLPACPAPSPLRLPHQGDVKVARMPIKPHSTPRTLKWLEETYELAEGVCIPRNALYVHYLDFCEKNECQPVNAASFGKIIRQQFPQITTRRLGTRGQSKYHYYGIGIKETSPYYEIMYSRKGVQSSCDGRRENIKQIVAYSPRSKLGTLLPEFPDVKNLKLPSTIPEEKVNTFLMMYRTHCQRILDTVIRANFDEVQSFLLHFWQGMPQHIVPILGTTVIVNLVGVCDSVLYKAVAGVLMPTVLQPLPDSLTQVIRHFAKQLDEWLRVAMENLPEPLRRMKFDLARRFAQLLKRQTSLNHLCQAARTVIHSGDITAQMLDDWANVDLASICKQTLYTMDHYCEKDHHMIAHLYQEFECLLEEQAPLEAYTEWLDSMVERCVIKPSSQVKGSLRRIARQFLLMWSCFGTRVIRDMTLHSAPSFGSFHLMHLMFDDYVLYLVETLHSQERASDLLRVIKGEQSAADLPDDILPSPVTSYSERYGSSGELMSPTAGTLPVTPIMTSHDRQSVIADTREAYAASNTYASQHHTPTSQNGSSPSQSPLPGSYDVRMDASMTSLSPCADPSVPQSPMATNQNRGYNDAVYYGRHTSGMTSSGNMSSQTDATSGYAYVYNSPSQYTYQRDYASTAEWNDMYRYGHTNSSSYIAGSRPADYGGYGNTRAPGYDVTPYGYDVTNGTAGSDLRGVAQQDGMTYPMYNPSAYYEDTKTTVDSVERKRKHDVIDPGVLSAKRGLQSDYEYNMAGEYARA